MQVARDKGRRDNEGLSDDTMSGRQEIYQDGNGEHILARAGTEGSTPNHEQKKEQAILAVAKNEMPRRRGFEEMQSEYLGVASLNHRLVKNPDWAHQMLACCK